MCNFLGSVAMHQLALQLGEAWRCCGLVLTVLCFWGASFCPAPTSRGHRTNAVFSCSRVTTAARAFDFPQETGRKMPPFRQRNWDWGQQGASHECWARCSLLPAQLCSWSSSSGGKVLAQACALPKAITSVTGHCFKQHPPAPQRAEKTPLRGNLKVI